ncbi:MAG: flagellar hook-length control protein FliK [Magnetococcales bacterium]|nr:flagellar hook-length control protein FliK [Magnetococcales bacterium]
MNIAGLLQTGEVVAVKALVQAQIQALNLELGQLLTAKVTQVAENGRGILQLADGGLLSFIKGGALNEGEQVRLQVVRTLPEMTLRVVSTEAGEAGRLADTTQRSVLRAPDIFSRLLRFSGLMPAAADSTGEVDLPPEGRAPTQNLPQTTVREGAQPAARNVLPELVRGTVVYGERVVQAEGGRGPVTASLSRPPVVVQNPLDLANQLVSGGGEKLSQVVRNALPHVSLFDLQQGRVEGLVKLMTGQQQEQSLPLREAIQRLRVAAESLKWVKSDTLSPEEQQAIRDTIREAGGEGAVLREAKTALQRLGDVLAAQDLLPKNQPAADGSTFLGYRVFWMPEGGMGEILWRREKEAEKGGGEGKQGFSVLLSLQLSRLGLVQAHISMGEGYLNVAISARDEQALEALRQDIGDLRNHLIQAELPLRTLNLSRLNEEAMQEERRQKLGFTGSLRMEA